MAEKASQHRHSILLKMKEGERKKTLKKKEKNDENLKFEKQKSSIIKFYFFLKLRG